MYESELLIIPHINKANHQALIKELMRNEKLRSLSVASLSGFKYAIVHHKNLIEDALLNIFDTRIVDSIIKHVHSLPWINFYLTVLDTENNRKFEVDLNLNNSINLLPTKEYEFVFNFNRKSSDDKLNVRSKKFPKKKDESWFVSIAYGEELIAIKRVVIRRKSSVSFNLTTPPGLHIFSYTIYVLSDSYLGLDQQYEIPVQLNN